MVEVNGREIRLQLCPNGRMIPGLARYFEYGVIPGHFLTKLLSNDLRGAVEYADDENVRLLPEWVRWLYNEAPAGSWGSQAKVLAWATARKAERSQRPA